jgi:hypothetical protein
MDSTKRLGLGEPVHKFIVVSPNIMHFSVLCFLKQTADTVHMICLCGQIHFESLIETPNVYDITNKINARTLIFFDKG